jgi:hypothetical protein
MDSTTEATAKCRKCKGSLDRNGQPEWCKACWAKYHREYEGTKEEKVAAKAFCEGAEAMRHVLVRAFMGHAIGMMYGAQCAKYISLVAPPRYGAQPSVAPGPQQMPSVNGGPQ